MHSTTLRSLVELLVVMSGRMGVRILILTREPLVVMGSHIMSCRHGTESRYLRISGDSIRMCTSMDLTGIFTEGIREINDLRWGGDE